VDNRSLTISPPAAPRRDGPWHWIVIGMMPTNQRAADSEPEPPTEDCCLEIGDMMVASG